MHLGCPPCPSIGRGSTASRRYCRLSCCLRRAPPGPTLLPSLLPLPPTVLHIPPPSHPSQSLTPSLPAALLLPPQLWPKPPLRPPMAQVRLLAAAAATIAGVVAIPRTAKLQRDTTQARVSPLHAYCCIPPP
ncbi:unnamed protein product [Ectocarpus sp. 12 AP-2014]